MIQVKLQFGPHVQASIQRPTSVAAWRKGRKYTWHRNTYLCFVCDSVCLSCLFLFLFLFFFSVFFTFFVFLCFCSFLCFFCFFVFVLFSYFLFFSGIWWGCEVDFRASNLSYKESFPMVEKESKTKRPKSVHTRHTQTQSTSWVWRDAAPQLTSISSLGQHCQNLWVTL